MPRRPTAPLGAPCWSDLSTNDPALAREFYCSVFGWTATDLGPEYGGYVTFHQGAETVCGMMPKQSGDQGPDAWLISFATADAEATCAAASAAGGRVDVVPTRVMELGTMAVLTDPGGSAFGLWQPQQTPGGTLVDEPGAPLWHELATAEYDHAVRFYAETLGLTATVMSDKPTFRYTQLLAGDVGVAGIMDARVMPPGSAPPGWVGYLGIGDLDAALATVERLGGAVGAKDAGTPHGDMAVVTDPTGAAFRLVQPSA